MYGWKSAPDCPVRDAFKRQKDDVMKEFETRSSQVFLQLNEQVRRCVDLCSANMQARMEHVCVCFWGARTLVCGGVACGVVLGRDRAEQGGQVAPHELGPHRHKQFPAGWLLRSVSALRSGARATNTPPPHSLIHHPSTLALITQSHRVSTWRCTGRTLTHVTTSTSCPPAPSRV